MSLTTLFVRILRGSMTVVRLVVLVVKKMGW